MKQSERRAAADLVPWLALALSLAAQPSSAATWLDGRLSVYGFLGTRTAMWTQSHPTQPILIPGITEEPPDNRLAVFRTVLQVEADWRIDDLTELHAVMRGVLEPRYAVDRYANDGSRFGSRQLAWCFYCEPNSPSEIFRELWIQRELAPGQSIRLGRQIVNWGESLAFRVADVINPNDSRYSLFFLDPEEQRIPQWMAQGLHDFPTLPGSPGLEWIVVPPFDEQERRVDELAPTGARFAAPPEDRTSSFPAFAGQSALWTVQRATARGGAVDFRFLDDDQHRWPSAWRFGVRLRFTMGPLQLALFDWYGTSLLPVVEDHGLLPYTIADYDTVLHRPDLADVYTALGVPPAAQSMIPLDRFEFRYPRQNVVGATGNAYLAPLRAVLRFEAVWRSGRPYQIDGFDPVTGVITDQKGFVRGDEVQWQIAFDFAGLYVPALNREGDFSINVEYTQNIVLDHDRGMRVSVWETRVLPLSDTLSVRASTSYAANTVVPSVILIYQPHQEAWAVVASLGLTAPWDENLTAELRYVAVGGQSAYDGLGFFRRKDFAMLSLRYGF